MRKILITLFTALLVVLVNPAPAQATHVGPFVANWAAGTRDVLIRGDDGLRYWQYVPEGHNSSRGANGFFVYRFNKVYYESLATGARYTTYCGREYERLGYTRKGKPYFPMNPDRSVKILDVYYAPECAW